MNIYNNVLHVITTGPCYLNSVDLVKLWSPISMSQTTLRRRRRRGKLQSELSGVLNKADSLQPTLSRQ